MGDILKKASKKLTPEQIAFIAKEFNTTAEEIQSWDEDKWDEIYDALFDIEVDEVMALGDNEPETERCIMASDIVTDLGDAIRKANKFAWIRRIFHCE